MSTIIKLANLRKKYHMPKYDLEVLKGINFEIEKGELVSIIGASGSGKSTLMNIIGLLDHPTSGSYLLDNREVGTLTDDQRSHIRNYTIGFVFQQFFLLPQLDAVQNVSLPLRYRNIDKKTSKKLSMEMLERVEMEHSADHKPHELSGGQQQRVAVARALVGNPSLILADEPTGSLDSHTSKEVMDLFLELNQRDGKTILIITHDHGVAEQCKRIVKVKDGKVVDEK